jgi:hypothetical protein
VCGFLVACRDAAVLLDLVDEALDQMALLVEVLVVRNRLRACGVGGDHGPAALCDHRGAEPIGVKGGVADHELGFKARNQCLGLGRLVGLARREAQAHRIAERIDGDVQLGRQAAARTPDRLSVRPPF